MTTAIPNPKIVDPYPMETAHAAAEKIVYPEPLPATLKSSFELLKTHDKIAHQAKTPAEKIAHANRRKVLGEHVLSLQHGPVAPVTLTAKGYAQKRAKLAAEGQSLAREIKAGLKKSKLKK